MPIRKTNLKDKRMRDVSVGDWAAAILDTIRKEIALQRKNQVQLTQDLAKSLSLIIRHEIQEELDEPGPLAHAHVCPECDKNLHFHPAPDGEDDHSWSCECGYIE